MNSVTLETHDYDVVVIGGGPNGIGFAAWLMKERPETRVAVVEKRPKPGYKIGESTLLPSLDAIVSLGVSVPLMRRLFNEKLGLRFWCTRAGSDEVGTHVSASDWDETFQLERRVIETVLLRRARRRGIDVFESVEAVLEESDLESDTKELICDTPGKKIRIRAKLVCDASGPASLIPRYQGLYRKDFDSFQTNAYFGYFRRKGPDAAVDVPEWDNAATHHIHFPEGWVWFIPIVSWDKAPQANLERMVDHLLDLPDEDGPEWPTRSELSERFDCPIDHFVSIGIVPRADIDSARDLPVEERFQHYVDKYPGLKKVMDNYELIQQPYEEHPTIAAFKNMAHYSGQYAGDGWLTVGDAAYFVNPLFSPGLAYGLRVTNFAAKYAAKALETGDVSPQSFAEYEQVAQAVFSGLLQLNEMLYRGGRHPEMFERCYLWWLSFSVSNALAKSLEFAGRPMAVKATGRVLPPAKSPILDSAFIERVGAVVQVQRDGEASGEDPAETARKVAAVIDPFIDEIRNRKDFDKLEIGRVFQDYDDQLNRVTDKHWQPLLETWRCPKCLSWNMSEDAPTCKVCGTPAPAPAAVA